MLWISTALLSLAALAALGALIAWLIGRRIPEEHVAAATLHLRQAPEAVWAVVSDCKGYKSWAPGVTKVRQLPSHDGHEVWRQQMGRSSVVLETIRAERPRVLVRTIADEQGHINGRWEYRIAPASGGCKVVLTERACIKAAARRFVMRYLLNANQYVRSNLEGLARSFHETPVIE